MLVTGSSGAAHGRRSRDLEGVADAVHGADQAGAELVPQRLDVAVDGAGGDAGEAARPTPTRRRGGARGSAPGPARGPGRRAGRTRSASGAPPCRRASYAAGRGRRPGRRRPAARAVGAQGQLGGPLHPAQQRRHPGDHLPHPERLGEVVVGARRPRPTRTSASSSRAVSMSTGTGRSAWMRRHTSWPSRPGSITSRTTTSGSPALRRTHGGRAVERLGDVVPLGPQPLGAAGR